MTLLSCQVASAQSVRQGQKRRIAAQIAGSGKLSADHSPDHNDIRLPAAISDLAERIMLGQQRYAATFLLFASRGSAIPAARPHPLPRRASQPKPGRVRYSSPLLTTRCIASRRVIHTPDNDLGLHRLDHLGILVLALPGAAAAQPYPNWPKRHPPARGHAGRTVLAQAQAPHT